MEPIESASAYLAEVSERVEDYFEALELARDFVVINGILENEDVVYYLLVSLLWVAAKRNETLTEEDICIFMCIDEEHVDELAAVNVIPEMALMSLEEVLEYVRSNQGLF